MASDSRIDSDGAMACMMGGHNIFRGHAGDDDSTVVRDTTGGGWTQFCRRCCAIVLVCSVEVEDENGGHEGLKLEEEVQIAYLKVWMEALQDEYQFPGKEKNTCEFHATVYYSGLVQTP